MAGGRYDNLVEEMGGPATPGIGFAIGVERLSMLISLEKKGVVPSCFFAYLGERAESHLVPLLKTFTEAGMKLGYSYEGKSLKAQMRYADSLGVDYVLILGDDEVAKNIILLRDMRTKNQIELGLNPSEIVKELIRQA